MLEAYIDIIGRTKKRPKNLSDKIAERGRIFLNIFKNLIIV
jgi:hypothetical protein